MESRAGFLSVLLAAFLHIVADGVIQSGGVGGAQTGGQIAGTAARARTAENVGNQVKSM